MDLLSQKHVEEETAKGAKSAPELMVSDLFFCLKKRSDTINSGSDRIPARGGESAEEDERNPGGKLWADHGKAGEVLREEDRRLKAGRRAERKTHVDEHVFAFAAKNDR